MNSREQVDTIVAHLKPMLATHGKDVSVIEATDEKIRLGLTGFCGGGCGCSSDYVEGLKEMMAEQFPDLNIQFEIA
ncbi:MAG: NifU family protein [Patescibacteria group bacterium]|jgi:Fe-S cluster biogenesis protein NfuA